MPIEQTTTLVPATLDGSAGRGGWQITGGFANDQAVADFSRHAQVYLKPEGGGSWEDDYKLAISGSILPKTLVFDRRQSNTEVTIATSDVFLQNAGLQGIYFSEQPSPENPHQMTDLTLGKIVYHIITEHTNIADVTPGGWVDVSGIDRTNSTSVDVYTVRRSDSIWNSIAEIASNEFYVRYFTKNDELIYEPHPQYRASLPSPTLLIDNTSIVGQPTVQFTDTVRVDQVQMYSLKDDGEILRSDYPATVGTEGRKQQFTNIRCNSQARLNLLAERAYKHLNREYNVKLTLAGPWGAYLELYDRVSVTYSGTAMNGVEISWSAKKFWITGIRVTKAGSFIATTELDLEEERL
jgi:hypothetical protein